jgi:hypothetical protein
MRDMSWMKTVSGARPHIKHPTAPVQIEEVHPLAPGDATFASALCDCDHSSEEKELTPLVPSFSRKPVEHDVARLRDGRGNDARSAVAMDAVEQQLSPPRESATQADAMGTAPGTAAVGAGLELAAADEEDSMTQLCARSEREQGGAWDRFSSGAIRPTDLELSEPSRPPTPPNLIRTIQVRRQYCTHARTRLRPFPDTTPSYRPYRHVCVLCRIDLTFAIRPRSTLAATRRFPFLLRDSKTPVETFSPKSETLNPEL